MSRLLIPNTTQVPNVLLDEVIPTLKPAAVRILLAIVRFTYGFGKPADRISFTQLAKVTGLSRWGVNGAVDELRAREIIIVKPGAKGRGANEYSLNLDISTGQLVRNNDQSYNLTSQVGSQLSRLSQTKSKPKKRESTESDKQIPDSPFHKRSKKKPAAPAPATLAAFEAFYAAYPRHVAKQKAFDTWLGLNPDAELISVIMGAVERYAGEERETEPRFILHPATWLNGRRWDDEPARSGNGHAKAPEVKDLGNGMMEVDGLRMARETYERKYGRSAK